MDSSSPEQSLGEYLSDQVKIMEMQAVISDATNGHDILLFPDEEAMGMSLSFQGCP